MQDTFRCYTCGAQNLIGEDRCTGCGQSLPYTCPRCGYPVNKTFSSCPYCRMALHWPNRQQSRTTYADPATRQHNSNSLFTCSLCGTQNIIGVRRCRRCNQQFNYTCPSCNAWVDNTFVNCPNCRRPLQWPAERGMQGTFVKNSPRETVEADYEETGKPKKEVTWPVVVLGAGLLFILAFGLILGFSPSTMTVLKPAAVHALSDAPTTNQQPAISTPSSIPSTVSATTGQPSVPTPPDSSSVLSSQPDKTSTSSSTVSTPASVAVPSGVTTSTDTGAWNTTADNYLQNLDPKWGTPAAPDPNCPLCNGGSRIVQSQGQELLTK